MPEQAAPPRKAVAKKAAASPAPTAPVSDRKPTMRDPFPPEQIGKLPKGNTFLDYVGHADITARLLDVDPGWNWEPLALDDKGLPALDDHDNLWISLTVNGVTRLGVGDGKNMKERIGDALRNAAMRFGAALELWAKGDRTYGEQHGEGERQRTTRTESISTHDEERPVQIPEDPEVQDLILNIYAAGQEDNPAELLTGLTEQINKHRDATFTANGWERTIGMLQDAALSGRLKGREYQP